MSPYALLYLLTEGAVLLQRDPDQVNSSIASVTGFVLGTKVDGVRPSY